MTNQNETSLTTVNSTKPVFKREIIRSTFKNDKLDKEKGNWTEWHQEIQTYLDMVDLSSHLTHDILTAAPSPTLQPNAYRNYLANDR